jgi:polyisoprenoid-binding protein YceI
LRQWLFAWIIGFTAHTATAGQTVWQVDTNHSTAQVAISLRLPLHPVGSFEAISGELRALSEQEMSVHLVLNAQKLEMAGPSWVQKSTVSTAFLDVANYPQIVFLSQAFPRQTLISGGQIKGQLSMKGKKREVVFAVSPTTCHRPGFSCPILGNGQINRFDFGMNANAWAVRDEVRFSFQLKFMENE